MKRHTYTTLWLVVVATLCGCASEQQPAFVYHQPLISPGGEFASLPPAVQNSVRAQAGMAEIVRIVKHGETGPIVYEVRFRDHDVYPPLFVATDGSVLNSNFEVMVGASEDSIAASTGNEASGLKMDELPPNVTQTIRHQAPTAEVDYITRLTRDRDIFYNVSFKDPANHPKILIRDDGKLIQ
jgi:hypothetical protein